MRGLDGVLTGSIDQARDTRTGELVALKRIREQEGEKEGMPITSIREIQILKMMEHPNIVKLLDIVTNKQDGGIFLVFEFVEHDLATLMDQRAPFTESEVKRLIIVSADCDDRHETEDNNDAAIITSCGVYAR